MAGVWVFRNGVAYLVQNNHVDNTDGQYSKRKALIYRPTNQTISSYADLEQKLSMLGWSRYSEQQDKLQFHKGRSGVDLITLPRDSMRFTPVHMFDIVLKNRGYFEVRDVWFLAVIIIKYTSDDQ